MFGRVSLLFLAAGLSAWCQPLRITADRTTVAMGRTVLVKATLSGNARGHILLAYVNGQRWGSHERPDASGSAEFLLPLPNPGPARIQVLAVKSDTTGWQGLKDMNLLLAGRPMPERGLRSNAIDITVTRRAFPKRPQTNTLFCVQWEPWFTPQAYFWSSAQAVPVMGFYESYNRDVTRQHILWFMDAGVDFIMADWSNHIWGKRHWDERHPNTDTILHATQLALEVLASMRDEGLPVPKMSLLTGLSNGPPASIQALNEEHEWVYRNYVMNPRFKGLWQELDGKPLIMPLDTAALAHPGARSALPLQVPFFKQTLALSEEQLDLRRLTDRTPVDESRFTVRWISSQNQLTRHHELGYWSWMDGSLKPMATYRDGKAEAVTVSIGFFGPQGWRGEGAYGRRDGWTYIEQFRTALETRPRVVFLHQFQEYAGQADGQGYGPNKNVYGDSYSVELSDDFEPVSRTARGFRGDEGGWGYYYLNLTRALIDVYRGQARDSTVLAVRKPYREGDAVRVEWSWAGKSPSGFAVTADGKTLAARAQGQSFTIPAAQLGPGTHRIRVAALDAVTLYPLSATHLDTPLAAPAPAAVEHSVALTPYEDGRPSASLRMPARDHGVVLRHGGGPGDCDRYGARDVWVWEHGGTYYMHYDAAGPTAWLAALATSRDGINWDKKGPVLDLGGPGEDDSKSASYGVTYFDGKTWHMFYLGTPNTTPPPDRIPAFPYLTMKATANSPVGPWKKQRGVVPWRPTPGSFNSVTASPGFIVRHKGEYLQFYSAATQNPQTRQTKRTIAIARTRDLNGAWKTDSAPILPLEEQIENTSLYYEPTNRTWFLFTNHIGIRKGVEYTDAIWVYWTRDLERWDPKNKAVVLDPSNCKWTKHVIGLPSVVKVSNRLALYYDALAEDSLSHMRRDVGLAWIELPLRIPGQ